MLLENKVAVLTGAAQGMSPALVTKYLDAAKEVASLPAECTNLTRFGRARKTERGDMSNPHAILPNYGPAPPGSVPRILLSATVSATVY